MLLTLAKFELKNLIREKMTMVMLIWPLIFGSIGKYLIDNGIVEGQAMGVTAALLSLIGGFAYGAMAGFSLLDDRDDQVFDSIQISPVSLKLYIWFKVFFVCILSVFAGFFIMWFTGATTLSFGQMLVISVLAALQTPFIAFLINAFAKNKVEGFVTMKATGFLLMLPVGGFFFLDAKEWLFSIAPGHWAAKAVQYSLLEPHISAGIVKMNLNFYQYIGIGFVYNLLLILGGFSLFKKKNNL
jgi:fluoroquinolone transport system permease protein